MTGDTLFVLGCGRLFEGSPAQMWTSLGKLLPLPASTRVFCAHEYTQSNARFALHANPTSTAMQQRKQEIDDMRSQVSCPCTLCSSIMRCYFTYAHLPAPCLC